MEEISELEAEDREYELQRLRELSNLEDQYQRMREEDDQFNGDSEPSFDENYDDLDELDDFDDGETNLHLNSEDSEESDDYDEFDDDFEN